MGFLDTFIQNVGNSASYDQLPQSPQLSDFWSAFGTADQSQANPAQSSGQQGSGGRGAGSTSSYNLVEDPFFTILRDVGSYVPIFGPAISTVGAFGNYVLTGEQSSPEGATSRAKDVVENRSFEADPWLIQPTADDVRSSMDDEQFDWYQRQFMPAASSIAAEAFGGLAGGALANAGAKVASKSATEATEKAVGTAAKEASELGDDAASAFLKGMEPSANFPKAARDAIKNAQLAGLMFGEGIPRILRPLVDSTNGTLDIGGLAYTGANMAEADKTATVYGVPVDELNRMYEYQIYNKAMEDKAYRDAFVNRYGDTFKDFAAYGNLGNDLDYNSNRRDVTRDIFGLNDDGANDLEIQGLKDIYFENGTINEDMTNEEMLDAILNYHWGADNIINPYQWMNDSDYEAAHALMGPDIAQQYWDYWIDNGYLGLDDTGNAFSGLGNDWDKLDMKDLSAYINAGNLINLANEYGYVPTDADMEKISDVFGRAGDKSRFTWMPENADTKEMNGRTYSPQEWNPGSLNYSSEEIVNALMNAQVYGDYSGLNPYFGFGDPLIHANMTDAVASALEKSSNGKKIGRG